jgi:hypothetical protein
MEPRDDFNQAWCPDVVGSGTNSGVSGFGAPAGGLKVAYFVLG